jgi:uncharacterized protein DUF4399/uncharacterized protein DUF6130
MKVLRHLALLALPIAIVAGAACSSEPKPADTTTTSAAAPAPAPMATTPRAFFSEPADGATVTSPVQMTFASEGVTIMPVPEGEVTMVRPAVGHYHLAIDTECLAPGAEIKKGEKWIHYGKGDTKADTQLPPGSHKLTLAIGDDKHVQMAGLCKTITVNVAAPAAQ